MAVWNRCDSIKKTGNHNINRLRTILLYEADFNMMNKQVGRLMMQYGEMHGVLASDQYGRRKHCTAI